MLDGIEHSESSCSTLNALDSETWEGYELTNRRANVKSWKMQEPEVDSHIRRHCFVLEPETIEVGGEESWTRGVNLRYNDTGVKLQG